MIFKNLFRRKSRSLLTLAGIVIGVAAMIALGAMGAGLASGYQAMAGSSQADLVLSEAEAYDLSLSSVDALAGERLRSMPEVKNVAGMLIVINMIETASSFMIDVVLKICASITLILIFG